MRYEPVSYIVEYEVGALAIFLVIMARYFGARRFPNQRNRLFSLILWGTVANMALDVASSLVIDNVFLLPLWATYLINTAFYSSSILMLVLMMLYTMAMVERLDENALWRLLPLLAPGIAVLFLLLVNPFTHWFFYVDPTQGYVHGPMFIFIYVACFVYLLFTFIIALRGRGKLRGDEFSTITRFLTAVLCATLVQYLYPALLLTGVAIALSVVLMYFTLQNPDAMVDATTGAFTYEAMLSFLRDRVQEREHVQLIAVKIRNMSSINDLLGIENGSLLLGQVSRFLREGVADSWVFRMRGSCFVAVTRRTKDYHTLRELVDQRVERPWVINGTEIMLQATVCYINTDDLTAEPLSPEAAVDYLEIAFSQSGRSGGSIVKVAAGTDMLEKVKRNRAVEAALREALNSGEGLELYFQPLWSVKRERFERAEVLLRFHHPVMGSIPPGEFVAIAENNGLIMALDELVVRKVCAFMQEHGHLRDLGLSALEVNLSALEFMRHSLPETLRDLMAEYRVDRQFLCFEITETAATESFELLRECMTEIRRFGCEFALDDFGTGYANISQVIRLPFSLVKLDKSLLYGPPVVLADMARMFARMGRHTVVEGVETAEQAGLVKAYEVDYIQGYYYAIPMNQSDFVRFLENRGEGRRG